MKTVDHSHEKALIMHDRVHIHVIMNIIVIPTRRAPRLLVIYNRAVYHISPVLVSNSDTELELEEAFQGPPKSDQAFAQNPDHFEKHSTMQSTENTTAAQNIGFTIDLDDEEPPRSLESVTSDLDSPQRSFDSPQRSLLEEAEAVVARLRPTSSPYQASSNQIKPVDFDFFCTF